MTLNPFPVIWVSEPARIPLPGDGAAALARLRERLPRFSPRVWIHGGCLGRVTGERVRLQRYRAMRRNDFAPVLDARVVREGRGAALVGEFRAGRATRWFMSLWFGLLIAFIPLFFVAGAVGMWGRDRTGAIVFMTGPSLMFLLGRGTLAFSQRRWNGDKAFIERFVADAVRDPEAP